MTHNDNLLVSLVYPKKSTDTKNIGTPNHSCAACFALAAHSPSNMPAWYLLQLDPWQLSLKYSNSATELPSDLVCSSVS